MGGTRLGIQLEVIEKVRNGEIRGFVSVLSFAIIYFFCSQEMSRRKAREELIASVRKFEIVDNTYENAKLALKDRRFSDVEDALQFYSAKTVASILVTRNKRDYRRVLNAIEVLNPEEFLAKYP